MPVCLPLFHRLPARPAAAMLAALLLALPVASGAFAQSGDTQALIDRINRLERDLTGLQRQVYRGGTPPASSGSSGAGDSSSLTQSAGEGQGTIANRLNSRIDDLEARIRELTGRFEEVEFKTSQAQQRMTKLVEDVDFRLLELERRGQPGAAGTPPAGDAASQSGQTQSGQTQPGQPQPLVRGSTSSTPGQAPSREGVLGSLPTDAQGRPLPPSASAGQQTAAAPASQPSARAKLPQGTPQERYNYAYRLLVQSDYADAEGAFREFVSAHGQDPLAGNAQYWLGETHYVRQQYEPAAAAFLQGYQTYPKGAKASDSLLKLGMSLAALKKTAEACAALGQLGKEFPNAPPHVKDAAVRERGKLPNCK